VDFVRVLFSSSTAWERRWNAAHQPQSPASRSAQTYKSAESTILQDAMAGKFENSIESFLSNAQVILPLIIIGRRAAVAPAVPFGAGLRQTKHFFF
jgi:hypothetical protein